MNHNEFKKRILISLFGELSKYEQAELEEHLQSCEECRQELEQQTHLLSLVSKYKSLEVDEKLLQDARSQLRGAIRAEKQRSHLLDNLAQFFSGLVTAPYRAALSGVAVLAIGLFLGYLFFHSPQVTLINDNVRPASDINFYENDVKIKNIRFIDPVASDGEIEFTFDAVKPLHIKGNVNDSKVQRILTYAMLNEQNPGARLNSINAMDSEAPQKFDKDIKDALITVVVSDENPGVRREALKFLNKFPYDEDIKQAYIHVLTADTVTGLRIEAINALSNLTKKALDLKQSEVDLFKQKLETDKNSYIRYKTKTILQNYN
ncbi:MAG: zf-HC2 domain-containing protein [Ignavibacteriaceae bacterium]